MVSTAHVSNGCESGFDCPAGSQRRLEQVHLRRFRRHGGDDIRFCAQAEVHVTIDEPRHHGQPASVELARPARHAYVASLSGGRNTVVLNEQRPLRSMTAKPIDDSDIGDGEDHGHYSLTGMVMMMPPITSFSL
jgi:hypothetical protein